MSRRKVYFHFFILISALIVGGLSFWHSGFWTEGRNNVPNFTLIAMVLLVISQIGYLKAGLRKGKSKF